MSSPMRIFIGRSPRAIVVSSNSYSLLFQRYNNVTPNSNNNQTVRIPTVIIKKIPQSELDDESKYIEVKSCLFYGLLGLISINGSIFVGIISGVQNVGFPRWSTKNSRVIPSENIFKVLDVDFYSLDSMAYDSYFIERNEQTHDKLIHEHPCGSIKKLMGDGTFYFSKDYDISNIVKNYGLKQKMEYFIDNQDSMFIWNSSLTNEVVTWRNRLPSRDRESFDAANLLTFLIRGFCKTALVEDGDNTASVTLISRLSVENKDCPIGLECMDEDGKVPNFVETEVVVTTNKFIFSYTQVSGNIPLFWEVVDNQILYGRKIKVTHDAIHTQPAFDKHFDSLESKYGVVSVLNLIKPKSESQENLAQVYKQCAAEKGIKITNVEYSSSQLMKSPHKLLYLLKQDIYEFGAFAYDMSKGVYFGKQTGVIRINAFDAIERQIVVEKIISRDIIELATKELSEFSVTSNFLDAHDKLWSENSYWMERLYSKNCKNASKYYKAYSKLFDSKIKLYDPLHLYISHYLKQVRASFTYGRDISIFCGTFNVSGKIPTGSIEQWIFPDDNGFVDMAEVYIIGLEEVVELTPGHMLATDPYTKQYWEKQIITLLNKKSNERYIRSWSNQLGGVLLMLFIKESEYPKLKHIEGDVKKTGFGGMASNKGAVAMSFKYAATNFCIIASHLAAGLDNVEQRHNDYKTIFKNIRFSKGMRIKDHDAIIWMGDFNYRILMSNDDVRKLIKDGEFSTLFQKDQLNQQMISGESFPYFHEMPINFPPTYKFDPNTKTYDTSEKMRIPAWTDRILSRGENLRQLRYGYAEDIIFSDHRPVYATFLAKITVIDEMKKSALFSEIYEAITAKLVTLNEAEKNAFLSSKSLILESLEHESSANSNKTLEKPYQNQKRGKKLPPPSSDIKKWWIGNGKQVKVVLNVDSEKYILNPKRNPNPFVEDDEPLYIPR